MIGVHTMEFSDYLKAEGVNNSLLKDMARSPAHCWAMHHAQNRPERKQRPWMITGPLAHCAVLEPDAMAARYLVVPDDAPRRPSSAQWNAKKPSPDSVAAMAWWTEFNARAQGRQIITAEQYATAQGQLSGIKAHPQLRQWLESGRSELSVFWTDPATGLPCKARPDFWVHDLPDGRALLLDLKTCQSAEPHAFARTIANFGYHRQAAWYSDGWQAATGQDVAGFVFAAIPSEYPFIAGAYQLCDEALIQGREECAELLQQYADCLASGYWPGHGDSVQTIELPGWARRNFETEISYVD